MKSLGRLFLLATFAACLVRPAAGFAQTNLTFSKNGDVQVNEAIAATDDKDKVRNQPCKIFVIELVAGKPYQIDMMSKDLDSYLRLEDAAGKELAKDDDGGDGLNARITFNPLKEGKYRIIATTFNGGTGAFTLSIKPGKAAVLVKATEVALADGKVEINGTLTKEDPKDAARKGSVCKVYTIKLSAGKTFQIDMVSKDVDSYLRLEDATGRELAKDDDSGGFPNARIMFNCPADGTYRVVATTFVGGTGAFTLTINQK